MSEAQEAWAALIALRPRTPRHMRDSVERVISWLDTVNHAEDEQLRLNWLRTYQEAENHATHQGNDRGQA